MGADKTHQFHFALAAIAPKGLAYPSDPDSVFQRVLKGYAGVLAEHHSYVNEAVKQGFPHLTCTRLEDWEAALSLPDCKTDMSSINERRAEVMRRLAGWVKELPIKNGSVASIEFIKNVARVLGFEVRPVVNHPFRVGVSRVGDALGIQNTPVHIFVLSVPQGDIWVNKPFRVGIHRVGRRLALGQHRTQLECVLSRLMPARYELNFYYE